MTALFYLVESALVLIGSTFIALAALGVVRLPDVYTRMHSASKAGSVGSGLILLALALNSEALPETLRALAAIFFFLLTAPISAHLLAKASYTVGYSMWPGSVLDEMPEVKATTRRSDTPPTSPDEMSDHAAGETVSRRSERRPRIRWSEIRRT
ncbi:multicomponent Na+:H+ antiporter subunit G [Fulvimarina manganoxydans]|uniref:Multicomponent Na+:H+ antiporter subunit G n=1 Tax=Fulvimarina manganoxydans TaxID=937218 RepID=A0A1W1YI04_9HYPH|nr:multicomponent Na+:H+ antiporter subunit G [Fulvimarina manganoxydans]